MKSIENKRNRIVCVVRYVANVIPSTVYAARTAVEASVDLRMPRLSGSRTRDHPESRARASGSAPVLH